MAKGATMNFNDVLEELAALRDRLLERHTLEVKLLHAENERLRDLVQLSSAESRPEADLSSPRDAFVQPVASAQRVPSLLPGASVQPLVSVASVQQTTSVQHVTSVQEVVSVTSVPLGSDRHQDRTQEEHSLVLPPVVPGLARGSVTPTTPASPIGGATVGSLPVSGQGSFVPLQCRPEWVPDSALQNKMLQRRVSVQSIEDGLRSHKRKPQRSSQIDFISENPNLRPGIAHAKCMLHPDSVVCFAWDLANLLFIMFDVIMTPLQVFVSNTWVIPAMDWACAIFWTCDICFTFSRAAYTGTEILWDPWQIARLYFRSWFLVDVLIILPDWVLIVARRGALSFLRVIRLLRLLRLLRVVKLERVVQSVEARIHSTFWSHSLGIMRLVFFIVILNHLLACVWYYLGVSSSDGWAAGSRCEYDLIYGYVTSLHWSITQFHASMEIHPESLRERVFSVVVVLVALIVFSQFLSSLTDMMIQLHRLRQDKNRQHDTLQTFFAEHEISTKLSMMVKKVVESKVDLVKKQAQELEVLETLPRYLLMDIYNEARVPILSEHSFFQELRREYPRAVRMLCFEAISQRALQAGETIFSVGDPCSRMLFVEQGSLVYSVERERTSSRELWKLRKGEWICEVALWGVWANVGELVALRGSLILEIDAVKLSQVLGHFERAYVTAVIYAKQFVAAANRGKWTTDLNIVVATAEDEPGECCTLTREGSGLCKPRVSEEKHCGIQIDTLRLSSIERECDAGG